MTRALTNIIAGDMTPAVSGATIDNRSSVTGEVLCTIPRSNADDVSCAVQAASAARQGPWSRWTVAERADFLECTANFSQFGGRRGKLCTGRDPARKTIGKIRRVARIEDRTA